MSSNKKNKKRKDSVNTLLLKTLQLSSEQQVAVTTTIPETRLLRSQSDKLNESTEIGDETTRGRSARRANTERNAERSIRDMIVEIETRAKSGQISPRYAKDIYTLPNEYINWQKGRKSPRRSLSPPRESTHGSNISRPVVNIIGCQQSTELILARADDRIRRQLTALEMRDLVCQEQRNRILKLIADQETKAERIVLHLKRQQQQAGMIKIVTILLYLAQLKPMVMDEYAKLQEEKAITNAAGKIAHNFVSWHQRKHAQRYLGIFRKVLGSNSNLFLVRFRILYKRMCVKRIKSFFTETKDRNKVSTHIHTFLNSVRLIQKGIRNFIACRLCKIRSTIIIWDRLELQYVQVICIYCS